MIYGDLRSFEVHAGHSGFRGKDESKNELRGKVEGGRKLWENGVQVIWSSSASSSVVALKSNESSQLSSSLAGNGQILLQLQ